ncbi:hypothetical protein KOR42_17090 [Thalassoglobus neptunius]|uniref:HEAT repeat protein n=1 Tax=Thalassoglobus neptunius TaxID=1938619 RepID=A0A5C5X868_9PLAN|nr:HEAT repeat domain-containing protein [Thalassoglobus neptunius]TWT58335.1 hypothetical protein KOR42_17090 [Thalassoglobus neptunius]
MHRSELSVSFCERANSVTENFCTKLNEKQSGSKEWRVFLTDGAESQDTIIQILSFQEIGDSNCSSWIDFLKTQAEKAKDATVLCSIFVALAKLRGLQFDDFVQLLNDPDISRRSAAIVAVEVLPEKQAVELFLFVLRHDPDASQKQAAAIRLARLGRHDGESPLLDCIERGSFAERTKAAYALSLLGNPVGVRFLLETIHTASSLSPVELSVLTFHLTAMLYESNIALPELGERREIPVDEILNLSKQFLKEKLRNSSSKDNRPSTYFE